MLKTEKKYRLLAVLAAVMLAGCGQEGSNKAISETTKAAAEGLLSQGSGEEAPAQAVTGSEPVGGKEAPAQAAAGSEPVGGKEASAQAAGSESAGGGDSASGDGLVKISFAGQDLEGNPVSSQILASSKLTMVNVWATYCNPCLREMPDLGALAGEYAPEEFQILGIISDVEEGSDQKMKDLASELVEKTGAAYTHLLLNESLYYALLTDVSAVPTTFFFDQEGNLLKTLVGSMDKAAWEEEINALLEAQ